MAATTSIRYESRPVADLPLSMRGRQVWHRSAPARILTAGAWDSGSKGWRIWRDYLAGRKRKGPGDVWDGKIPNWLRWSETETADAPGASLDKQLTRLSSRNRRPWRADDVATVVHALEHWGTHPGGPLDCLRVAYQLPALAQTLEGNAWWDLLDRLIQIAVDADSLSAEEMATTHQMLSGELRITLAYLFPELKPCRKLAPRGAAVVSEGIVQLSSETGALHATQLADLRLLLACWTRSLLIGSRLKRGALSSLARARYAHCVTQATRLLTAARQQLLVGDAEQRWPRALVDVTCQVRADLDVGSTPHVQDSDETAPASDPQDASQQSDEAEYAVLRSGWKSSCSLLAVDHSTPEVVLDLNVAGEALWRGPWRLDIALDGQALEQLDDWESVCWESDKDVAYLELQGSFSGGVKVQRQMLLAKRDELLYLSDVILPTEAGSISYRSSLPCRPAIIFQPAHETRELKMLGSRRQLLVLPLALSEWIAGPSMGELTVRGTQVEYRLEHNGPALAAPLFIDLKQKKREQPFTWRPLTVAENRTILSRDDAVAHRVQIGNRRYLFYRSLATRGTRTVLGAHLASEFLASRMLEDGQLETLVEIE